MYATSYHASGSGPRAEPEVTLGPEVNKFFVVYAYVSKSIQGICPSLIFGIDYP